MMRYAVTLTPDSNDTLLATVPDIPGAISFGDDVPDALAHATDAITSMISALMSDRQPIPRPRAKGLHYVELPQLVVAKVAIYNTMLERNLRKADLVRLLAWKPVQVDRLLNLSHGSRLDQIEQAFRVLGKRLEIAVKDAA
jgi:antitoxin HicB